MINFSDLCIFPIFLMFIFKLDANFPSLQPKCAYFIDIFLFYSSNLSKKYIDFSHKSGIWRIESKKYTPISVISREN